MPSRDQVYAAINSERAYQDHMSEEEPWNKYKKGKTTAEYVLRLEEQIRNLRHIWLHTNVKSAEPIVRNMRGIAATAVSCMEDHGAPMNMEPMEGSVETENEIP